MLLSSYLLDALVELPGESPAALRTRFLGWLPR
ncbi:hypothetical protein GA0070613_1694 [Micromonospora inositola]|uniref:Uncharacterized protein n=1 Tax=Micromonospora inositola TaxID=47865 RepID=A0A1C5HR55_9ACTN|nr:hypothetical protein GA0070613_1694 [Micromonospora inositola]